MCSIAGFVSKNKNEVLIREINDTLSHRGPDFGEIFIDKTKNEDFIHLSHNRLSILDISSKANQPFVSECGKYIIVYNGEVYNFKSIKEELLKKGYRFVSNSDTEVILYSYIEWGEKSVLKFIGMFAFCIYDKNKNILFLARDRAGVKPLYFFKKDETFLFSSEIKGIIKHPDFKKEIEKDALFLYFRFGYIPSPFTIFKDIYKFPAASYMIFDLEKKEAEIFKYWDSLEFYKKDKFKKSEKQIEKELEELLVQSALYRTVSDVPIGVFLSGGYDSSFVAAVLQKHSQKRINTFSIGFEEREFDESIYAREVAKYLKTNHHEHFLDRREIIDIATDLPFIYDEPFADDSAIPTVALSRFTKESVKVALSGDGGDEIFVGYSKYSALYSLLSLFSSEVKKSSLSLIVNMLSPSLVKFINDFLPKNLKNRNIEDKFLKFKRAVSSKDLEEVFVNASSIASVEELGRIFKKRVKFRLDKTNFSKFEEIENADFLEKMGAIDYITYLLDNSLVKVDRASMSSSLEAREPLIDHRLYEFMARVPVEIKFKNREKKYLFKKIVYKYIPKDILQRPKSGFMPPLYKWLTRELDFLCDIYLSETFIQRIGFFEPKEIKRLKDALKNRKRVNINLVWAIVVFGMWHEKWMKN